MMRKVFISCLLVSILGQGCKVYQNTPVSIEAAVSQGPVKVIDSEYDHWNFDTIVLMDSTYYGIIASKSYQKIELDPAELMSIRLLDWDKTSRSTSVTIFFASVAVVSVVLLGLILIWCC